MDSYYTLIIIGAVVITSFLVRKEVHKEARKEATPVWNVIKKIMAAASIILLIGMIIYGVYLIWFINSDWEF